MKYSRFIIYLLALRRANYKCEICHISLEKAYNKWKRALEKHHKNRKHNDDRLNNVKILCRKCHNLITMKYWDKELISKKLSKATKRQWKNKKFREYMSKLSRERRPNIKTRKKMTISQKIRWSKI